MYFLNRFHVQVVFFLLIFLSSCERRENEKTHIIIHTVTQTKKDSPKQIYEKIPPPHYPWNKTQHSKTITLHDFRCRGHHKNPPLFIENSRTTDCDGMHSLPLKNGKEWIPELLIDLLNYLQTATNQEVIILSGHRCPAHNTYIDPSQENRTSKHQVGAEVAFYVKGYEYSPNSILTLLLEYPYPSKTPWERYHKSDTNVSIPPWYNKDVFIKHYQTHEGKNREINCPHPHFSLQIRYDIDEKTRVFYSWDQAHKGYTRKL